MVDDTSTGQVPDTTNHAGTDRRPVGTSPESLYQWQIAVLQTRLELRDAELQHVIDRYEHVLEERATRDGELRTDGGRRSEQRAGCPACRLREGVRAVLRD